MCRRDILFFVNAFVYQFNPKAKGDEPKFGPFCTWDFQDEALLSLVESIHDQQDTVIEKSREMGASWICLIVMLWYILFRPGVQFLLVSRDVDSVDCKSPDSLFWKLRYMLRHLPDWLAPRMTDQSMYLCNEILQSYITGEASTKKAGIGGRATAIFLDEFSLVNDAQEIYDHTSDTASCRIFNFTHRGENTCASRLCKMPLIKKIVMHWSQHPRKNPGLYRYNAEKRATESLDSHYEYPPDFHFVMDGTPVGGPFPGLRSPWYDKEVPRKGSNRAVAMDLDINPEGATSQVFDPLVIAQLIRSGARPPSWEGDLIYDDKTGEPERLDKRAGGLIKLWCPLDAYGRPGKARYIFGTDTSTGKGASPTVFSVLNEDTGEKVLEYTNSRIYIHHAAPLAVALCKFFYNALMIWEDKGPGETFGLLVLDLGYGNCYIRQDDHRLDKKMSSGPKYGWVPNPANIRTLIEDYSEALRRREYVNYSARALQECNAFMYDKSGYVMHSGMKTGDESGIGVNHGDHVVADALTCKLAKRKARVKKNEPRPVPLLSLEWRRDYAKRQAEGEEAAIVWDAIA
jgi:hypothetical protein